MEGRPQVLHLSASLQSVGLPEERENAGRLRIVEQSLGMSRHDELAPPLSGDRTQTVEHLPLEDEVQMRIGFVQEKYRGRLHIEERQ